MLIVTDGYSQSYLPPAVRDARSQGVEILVLGIGGAPNYRELEEMGDRLWILPSYSNQSYASHVAKNAAFDGLTARLAAIAATACPDDAETTAETGTIM